MAEDRNFSSTDADLIFARVVPKAPWLQPELQMDRGRGGLASASSRRWVVEVGHLDLRPWA